jgi:hypothetical protein
VRFRIDEQVGRFDVPVADTHGVDVGEGTEQLIGVELHKDLGDELSLLLYDFERTLHCFRYIFHHDVQVVFISFFSLREKSILQLNNIAVIQLLHNEHLPILVPHILEHFLDRHFLIGHSCVDFFVACRLDRRLFKNKVNMRNW